MYYKNIDLQHMWFYETLMTYFKDFFLFAVETLFQLRQNDNVLNIFINYYCIFIVDLLQIKYTIK